MEVVDAVEFAATRQKHPELDRHLALADLVVVNKTDRAEDSDQVLGTVRSLADRAAVVPAAYGRIDPELLFDCRPAEERIGQLSFDDLPRHDHEHGAESSHHAHLHAGYDSLSFRSDVPMHPRRLLEFLDSRPEGLYRIKGYVDFGAADPRNRYAVHAVGRFLRFRPEAWEAGAERLTQLVLIGSGINTTALRKELQGCTDGAHTPTSTACGASCAMCGTRRPRLLRAPVTSRTESHRSRHRRDRLRQGHTRAVASRVELGQLGRCAVLLRGPGGRRAGPGEGQAVLALQEPLAAHTARGAALARY